jgi:hypothetical protein
MLIKECCERVIHELKNERLESIYESILADILPNLIEKELFQIIFDEMNLKKSTIQKIEDLVDSDVEQSKQQQSRPQKELRNRSTPAKRSLSISMNESLTKKSLHSISIGSTSSSSKIASSRQKSDYKDLDEFDKSISQDSLAKRIKTNEDHEESSVAHSYSIYGKKRLSTANESVSSKASHLCNII